jgi:hypothetical protein
VGEGVAVTVTEVQELTSEQFEDWAGGLKDKFLRCRDLGHRWVNVHADWREVERMYFRVARCSECTTSREQDIDYLGLIHRTTYIYPEGYQAPPGTGRLDAGDRGVLRLASIQRVISKSTTKKD